MTIIDLIIISSFSLGLFLSLSLIISPFFKSTANKYLALSLLTLLVIIITGKYNDTSIFLAFIQDIMLEFLVAITLFSYFLIQIEHRYIKQSWYKWLYLPFFITLLVDVSLDLDHLFNLYNSTFKEESFIVQLFYTLEEYLSFLYNVFFILFARKLIKKSTTLSKEKKDWLLKLNFIFIGAIFFWFITEIELAVFDTGHSRDILWAFLSFMFWWVLYYGVFKLQIVTQKDEIHHYLATAQPKVEVEVVLESKPKIQAETEAIKESIPDVTATISHSKYIDLLQDLMANKQLYKNPLLSRLDLANELGISEGYLSQAVNKVTGKNVIQFVNEYRVSLVKELLSNPEFDKYSIEAIYSEAGFNSKSVFYNSFKAETNMSPGMYRKSYTKAS
ncbi:AraC family transcriptional regulator [uncultured Flavobacterium sp.]|uniref:helix-turn-helix domain-containing protein n=1 Tax=uncultured Flavobacterium sp. TaxID=165435 RepID=UPI0025D90BE2|nr:helix-turn-helix domain-containing protein [uncultured Flavobacterium sp.]